MTEEKKTDCLKELGKKDKNEECSPEQIKKCHGDVEEHPCDNK